MKTPASQVKRGNALEMDGAIWLVAGIQNVKPGKGPAYQQIKIKNIASGKQVEKRFRSAESLEVIDINRRDVVFSYRKGALFVFMDAKTYEEVEIPADLVGDDALYLKEGQELKLIESSASILGIELPETVTLAITETEPGIKKATATNVGKPATLETGLTVIVPPFIGAGEIVRVETGTGEYIGRA